MILASSALARADVPPPLNTLPQCKVHELKAGGLGCCFTDLGEVKQLARADLELGFLRDRAELTQQKTEQLANQVTSLETALKAQKTATDVIRERNDELTRGWLETDRKLQLERVKPRWGGTLAWTTAAVLGALLAGFIAHDALN